MGSCLACQEIYTPCFLLMEPLSYVVSYLMSSIYMCIYVCIYIYTHVYERMLLVNTSAARSLSFTHSPDDFSFTPLWFWTLSFGPEQHRWNLRWLAPLRYNLNLDNRSSATWAKRGDKEAPEEWLTQDLATLKNVTEPGTLQRRWNLDGFDVWKEAKPRFKFARKAVEEHTNDLMQSVLGFLKRCEQCLLFSPGLHICCKRAWHEIHTWHVWWLNQCIACVSHRKIVISSQSGPCPYPRRNVDSGPAEWCFYGPNPLRSTS